jgi:hypothetical protein
MSGEVCRDNERVVTKIYWYWHGAYQSAVCLEDQVMKDFGPDAVEINRKEFQRWRNFCALQRDLAWMDSTFWQYAYWLRSDYPDINPKGWRADYTLKTRRYVQEGLWDE